MNYKKVDALRLNWKDVAIVIEKELQNILGYHIQCDAHIDDRDYWAVVAVERNIPMSDIYKLLEAIQAPEEEIRDFLPPPKEMTDTLDGLSMEIALMVMERQLKMTWESTSAEEKYLWLLGVEEKNYG